jgi:hypothetical protein
MNKLLAFTVPIGLLLVACGPQQPMPKNCVAVDPPGMCANAPGITINYRTHVVAPPNYCADPGEDIEVSVVPVPRNGDVGTVTTEPKRGHPRWLAGTNDPDPNGFVLEATDDEGDYYYNVIFSDGCIIDPKITI